MGRQPELRIPKDALLCVICGSDYSVQRMLVDQFLKEVAPGQAEFDVVELDAREATPQQALSMALEVPFFAKRKVVIVRDAHNWQGKEVRRMAQSLHTTKPKATVILLCAEKKRVSGTKEWAVFDPETDSLLSQVGRILDLKALGVTQAQAWARRYAKALGKDLVPLAAAHLCQMVGTDLGRLKLEVEKLALYVGSRTKIAKSDVEAVASKSPEESVFRLAEAVSRRNSSHALALLNDLLRMGQNESTLLAFIIRQFGLIAQAKYLLERKCLSTDPSQVPAEVLSRLPERENIVTFLARNPYWRDRYAAQAAKWSWEELERAYLILREADLKLKMIRPASRPADTLREAIAKLCSS